MRKRWLTILLTVVMMFTFTAVNVFAADSIKFVPVSQDNEYDVQVNGTGDIVTIYCLQQKDLWPGGEVNYVNHDDADDSFSHEDVDLLTDKEIQILKKLVYAGYPNDSQGILRKYGLDEEGFEKYAGLYTNIAIWTLMTEWGKAGSDPDQTIENIPEPAIEEMIEYALSDSDVKAPSSENILIEGSGTLSKDGDKWSTGALKITQPTGYNLGFDLDLPDGTLAVDADGEEITNIGENETFRIITDDPTSLSDFEVKATSEASYPTDVSFFVTKDETGKIDQTTGQPQTYQTMLYIEKETMNLAGSLNLTADPVGSLSVSKTVTGDVPDEDADKAFEFKVTLDNTDINGTYGEMTFENGVAVFTLKDGDTILAQDLPADIGYAVEETPCDNYVISKSHETGTIAKGTTTQVSFYNEYKAAPAGPGEVQFSGMKTLKGKTLGADEFSFTLTGEDDGVKETVKNAANGEINFSKISYNKPGEYRYTIREDATTEEGIITDSKVYNLKVTVTDDGDGTLKTSISGDSRTGEDIDFTNKYEEPGTGIDTGDDARLLLMALIMMITAGGICAVLFLGRFRRKSEQND